MSDYERLAHLHYRAGTPAVPVRVLRAVCVARGELAGVLVVAMPVLNGPWRRAAWPQQFGGLTKSQAAAEVNAHVRTIARVVVVPRFRSRGIACGLVRAYLAEPLTELTEALAAMGTVCPVFERAGMRRVGPIKSRAADGVVRALRVKGLSAWMLADGRVRRRAARDSEVARALRALAIDRWRAGRGATASELMERLWPGVASRPCVFVAQRPEGGRRGN